MRALVVAMMVAALAGSSAAAPAPDHAAALAELQRGVAAFRAGDYAGALPAFEAAQRLAPDKPNPYRWLALTRVQLGDCPGALVDIEGFLARVPPDEPRVPELVRLRELCQQTGTLRVDSTPPNAALRIDGAQVGTTPYTSLSMRAGTHTVDASKPGFEAQSRSVSITAGGEHELHFPLARTGRPLVRRWWFWTAVVGVTAAAAAGLAVALSGDDRATMLPPIECSPAGCQ
ncbi:MAG TPA: PEGA domain-containing protein [Kofleriaceae bacterium]|nr:PEGA domain-containing protein [Kofleriaceae bacterium]